MRALVRIGVFALLVTYGGLLRAQAAADSQALKMQACGRLYAQQIEPTNAAYEALRALSCLEEDDKLQIASLLQSLYFRLDDFNKNSSPKSVDLRAIAGDYKRVQELLALCRTNHILSSPQKSSLFRNSDTSDQATIFLHALGDVFGKDSGYEGFTSEGSLEHRLSVLRIIKQQMRNKSFIKDEKQAKPCAGYDLKELPQTSPQPDLSDDLLAKLVTQSEKAAELHKVFKSDLSGQSPEVKKLGSLGALQALVKQQLSTLEPGTSIFLPAGWFKHAVIYQITKQLKAAGDTHYTFRIFNSGEGIQYHTSSQVGYKTQVFPFVEVIDVPYNNITSLVFLKSLQEIAHPEVTLTTPTDFYERLLVELGGRENPEAYKAQHFEDPQKSGTCSYFSMPWLMSNAVEQFVGEKANREFIPDNIEFLIGLKTLTDYSNHLKRNGLDRVEQIERNLLRKGLQFFAGTTANAYESSAIDLGTLSAAADIQNGISENLQAAQRVADEQVAQNAARFDTKNARLTGNLGELKTSLENQALISGSSQKVDRLTFTFELGDWQLTRDKSKALSELRVFYKELEVAMLQGQNDVAVNEGIKAIALRLPLEKEAWTGLNDAQAQSFIEILTRFDELFLYTFMRTLKSEENDYKRVSTMEFLVSLKLLTLSDLLNQNFVTSLTPKIPSMYQARVGELLFTDVSVFENFDPRWQWQIKLLKDYYKSEYQANSRHRYYLSFFGFEELPAGSDAERIFYDDSEGEKWRNDDHWSLKINWRDIDWLREWWMKKPNFSAWLSSEEQTKEVEPISRWCQRNDLPESLWTCAAGFSTSTSRFSPPELGKDIVVRRKIARLLSANTELPATFKNLRTASIITDLILTSDLSVDKLSSWKPVYTSGLKLDVNSESLWATLFDGSATCSCERLDGQSTQPRIATVAKATRFNIYKIRTTVFGVRGIEKVSNPREQVEGSKPGIVYTSPYLHLKNAMLPLKKYESDKDNPKWQHDDLLRIYTTNIDPDGSLTSPNGAPTRRRYKPNSLILTQPAEQALGKVSLEAARHLFGISGFPGQQVLQTLAYFNRFPALLSINEYQRMFEKLALEPGLIRDQFLVSEADSQSFSALLAKFCNERFDAFQRFGDYKGMAFILHMAHLFQEQIDFAKSVPGARFAKDFSSGLMDARSTLLKIIDTLKAEQWKEESLLYRTMAATFLHSNQLSSEEVKLLLLSVIEHNILAVSDKTYEDQYAENSIRHLLAAHQEDILSVIFNPTRSYLGWPSLSSKGQEILSYIASRIKPELKGGGNWTIAKNWSSVWNSKGYNIVVLQASFKNPDATIQIDVGQGLFFEAGKTRVNFPLPGGEFERVFGQTTKPSYASRISTSEYEWVGSDGARVRAAHLTKSTWRYQRENPADSIWYQLMSVAEVQAIKDTKSYFEGMDHWQSINHPKGTLIRIFDSKTKKPVYESMFDNNKLIGLKRLSDGAQMLEAAKDSSYRVFGQIEPWRYVYVWVQPGADKTAVKEVELPRWGLTFARDAIANDGSFGCAKWQDFRVASKQFTVPLGSPVTYLVCESKTQDAKSNRKKLALMPNVELKLAEKSSSLAPAIGLGEIFSSARNSVRYFIYPIDEQNPDRMISPPSDAARYLLALRSLWQQNYVQAANFIRANSSELRQLNPVEDEILGWLTKGNGEDPDPRALATRLLAYLWLLKDDELYKGVFTYKVGLGELYSNYLGSTKGIERDLLAIDEEKRLISRLKPDSVIINRSDAIAEEEQGQRYIASPIITQLEGTGKLVASSARLLPEYLREMFFKTSRHGCRDSASALDATCMINAQNFDLLYQAVSGEDFEVSRATELLSTVLKAPILNPTREELRTNFKLLLRMAVLSKKSDPEFEKGYARFLLRVDEIRASSESVPTYDTVVADLRRIERTSPSDEKHYFDRFQASKVQQKTVRVPVESEAIAQPSPVSPKIEPPNSSIKPSMLPIAQLAKEDLLASPIFPSSYFDEKTGFFHSAGLTQVRKEKLRDAAASLNLELDKARSAPAEVYASIKDFQNKITGYAQKISETDRSNRVLNWSGLEDIRKELEAKIHSAEQTVQKERNVALFLAAKYPDKFKGGAYKRIAHIAGVGSQPTFDDLVYLLIKNQLSAVNETDFQQLYSSVVRVLLFSTYLQHALSLSSAVDAVLQAHKIGKDENSNEYIQLIDNMVRLGTEQRNYDIKEHIEYLAFEYFMRILVRDDQVKALDELRIVDCKVQNEKALGAVLEMIMGAGKTSVLLPLLSTLDPNGEWLNIIMLPEALLASMSEQLSQQLGSSFGRAVDVISFNRSQYLAERDLQLLYNRLVNARNENRTIITTNGAIQSLFLSMLERLRLYPEKPSQLRGEVEGFLKIFRFLRQYGRLTIDEVDLALDILQAHQFSVGSPVALTDDPVLNTMPAVALSLYRLIATTPSINHKVTFPFLPGVRGKTALTASSYALFKPDLVNALLDARSFFSGYGYFNKIFRDFTEITENREAAYQYLIGGNIDKRVELFSRIDSQAENIDVANRLKDIMALLYDEINVVLPLTATRKLGVHYGQLPRPEQKADEDHQKFARRTQFFEDSRFVAIPYHSGEPMTTSRFGTSLESLNYTIQMSLERGDYRDMVESEVAALKSIAAKGTKNADVFQRRFEALVGKNSGISINQVSESEIDRIVNRTQNLQSVDLKFDLIKEYVLVQIATYKLQIGTNAQVYESLFAYIQGFSGTLWSVDTFPKIFRNPIGSDTSEKTFLIVWLDFLDQQSSGIPIIKEVHKGDLIKQIYPSSEEVWSLMDEGGILRANKNADIASEIMAQLESNDAASGMIFYDDKDNIRILDKSRSVNDLESTQVPISKRVAYWDKKHTTGSNLKLRSDMRAKMFVDYHLMSRSFQQTAWRLRGLGQGQKVDQYLILSEDLDVMKQRMKDEWRVENRNFGFGSLLLYSLLNQESRLGNLRYRAVKQKLTNTLVKPAIDQMLSRDAHRAAEIYALAAGLFEKPTNEKVLYRGYGMPKSAIDVKVALRETQDDLLKSSFAKAVKDGLHGAEIADIRSDIQKLITDEEPKLPRTVISPDMNLEEELEIEAEAEKEKENEEEQEEEKEAFAGQHNYVEHEVLAWSLGAGGEFAQAFFAPIPNALLGTDPGHWLLKNASQQPLVSLPDALRYNKRDFLADTLHSPDILLSLNFAPVHHKSAFVNEDRYEYKFFDVYNKVLTDVLLIQDKSRGKVKLVLLDGNDVDQFDNFLAEDARLNSGMTHADRQVRLALYSLGTGIFRQGAEPIDAAFLTHNSEFLEHLVQVKFFAGITHYSADELPYLTGLLTGSGQNANEKRAYCKHMLATFKEILKLKRDTRRAFEGSEIYNIFENLLGQVE